MATNGERTTVNDHYSVTVPAAIRNRLDIQPGDKLDWKVTDDGQLAVEVVQQRYGAFDDFEAVDMGATNAAEDHDAIAVDAGADDPTADERGDDGWPSR
ncbi:AbrB/MazE/SpoVT family DNA-binding domain-containing protein [Halorussus salilacus]|uniref:AbrB/MazE/SpoVT family DNA-binding domain-containing protein n=1 Tax=Halorussus salilacus TaxID=2953750 RepID=UPI0020A16CEA|nr:AbrB/MazE/SpoVT family DNA-binding domain-containing protein [Halorussus salilacus]USZ68621.1 AbrB/MazE/SpoVT family DNA-binding domain-containing protein [Halorussus salilacus]